MTDFADPVHVLTKLDEALHEQYQQTNTAIRDDANPHLTINARCGFRVATPAQEEFDSVPLQRTLSQLRFVLLPEILATVNQHCGLLDEFRHWQQAHIRQPPNPATFFAGIMDLGCGIGEQRMARISPSVTERAGNWIKKTTQHQTVKTSSTRVGLRSFMRKHPTRHIPRPCLVGSALSRERLRLGSVRSTQVPEQLNPSKGVQRQDP